LALPLTLSTMDPPVGVVAAWVVTGSLVMKDSYPPAAV